VYLIAGTKKKIEIEITNPISLVSIINAKEELNINRSVLAGLFARIISDKKKKLAVRKKINPISCWRAKRDDITKIAGVIKNALEAINAKNEASPLVLVLIKTFLAREYTRMAANKT